MRYFGISAPFALGGVWQTSTRTDLFVEERDRSIPCQLCCGLLEARRGVVVEPMLRAGIEMPLVLHLRGLQCRLVRGPARIDALVDFGRLDHHRRLDLRGVLGRR